MEDEEITTVIDADDYFNEPSEPEPAPEHEETPAPEPAPEVDIEAERAALKKKEAELNKWNMKIAEREKALAAAAPQAPVAKDDDLPPLSEEAERTLDAYIAKRLGGKLSLVDTLVEDIVESEMEKFASANSIDVETLRTTLSENNIQPKGEGLRGIREAFGTAAKIIKADTTDVDALTAKIAELEAAMESLKSGGVRVESIEPSGRVDLGEVPDVDNDELSPFEKYNLLKQRK